MSNPWSGQFAKNITSKKRSKTFWNIFFSVAIFITLFAMLIFAFRVASEHLKYDSEQVFIKYENKSVITDIASFKIPGEERQEISINQLLCDVNAGDKITVTISKVSGELLQVKYLNKVVYKKNPTPIIPTVIASVFLVFPFFVFFIFMLIVTNIKNPGKRIDNLQKKYLLRFYK